jgi:hypothetical protein
MFIDGLKKLDLPVKTLQCDSGYFLMVDISECKDLIPEKFK